MVYLGIVRKGGLRNIFHFILLLPFTLCFALLSTIDDLRRRLTLFLASPGSCDSPTKPKTSGQSWRPGLGRPARGRQASLHRPPTRAQLPQGFRHRPCSQPAPTQCRPTRRSPSRAPGLTRYGATHLSRPKTPPPPQETQFSKSQLRRFRAMLISTGATFPGGRRTLAPTHTAPAGPPPSAATTPVPSPPLGPRPPSPPGWTQSRRLSSRPRPPTYTSPPPTADTSTLVRPVSPNNGPPPLAPPPSNPSRMVPPASRRIGWWNKESEPSNCL